MMPDHPIKNADAPRRKARRPRQGGGGTGCDPAGIGKNKKPRTPGVVAPLDPRLLGL